MIRSASKCHGNKLPIAPIETRELRVLGKLHKVGWIFASLGDGHLPATLGICLVLPKPSEERIAHSGLPCMRKVFTILFEDSLPIVDKHKLPSRALKLFDTSKLARRAHRWRRTVCNDGYISVNNECTQWLTPCLFPPKNRCLGRSNFAKCIAKEVFGPIRDLPKKIKL